MFLVALGGPMLVNGAYLSLLYKHHPKDVDRAKDDYVE
jgi:hypothetical protein